jgi:L-methionine (R)-S-oxide reductase
MDPQKKKDRYERLYKQLQELLLKPGDTESGMVTIVAVLHHHMKDFFWTGFYLLKEERLIVRTYQGSLACQVLQQNKGVCWAAINEKKTIVVPDVHLFPGHIACDSRSRSEIAVPLHNSQNQIIGVLDIDSTSLNAFDEVDAVALEKILALLSV